MAMSLKKIGAIAIGGAMVATTLASGAMAATAVGDVEGFMDKVVKDGQPNVEIVVGSNAAAMDVVSASDIAAKIGSMCYKEGAVEDGSVELKMEVSADTDLSEDLDGNYSNKDQFLIFTTPKRSYTNKLGEINVLNNQEFIENPPNASIIQKLPRLSTLVRDKDADPDDVSNNTKADAIEFLLASVEKVKNDSYKIKEGDLIYGSLIFVDGEKTVGKLNPLHIGMELPFLGETYRIVDTDDKEIFLGKEAYSGNIREGNIYDLGNGYQVKVVSVLVELGGSDKEVDVEIIKDGEVVDSKSDKIPFELVHKDVGVIVYDAFKNVAETHGFAKLIITKDVKSYEIGDTFEGDWKLYAITTDAAKTSLELTEEDFSEKDDNVGNTSKTDYLKTDDGIVYGLALRYEGSDIKKLKDGDKVDFVNDYVSLEFTDDDDDPKLYARYIMEVSKDLTLGIGEKVDTLNTVLKVKDIKAVAQQVVPVKAPIAKLDTETSLDSDKNMILVGGPVVNKLTKELQEAGKVDIDNESPATIQVVDGNILVVAGGDRNKTREAALYLIENY
ncbi:S-layer protein [Methanothermococcus sp. SCGC AD-155-C09]|nr:S-layer protein [Methanothermococcus sp. SCGC AD-155-C09]